MLRNYVETKAKLAMLGLFLKYVLPFLLLFGAVFGIIFMFVLLMGNLTNDDSSDLPNGSVGNVSQEVLQYKDDVTKYAKQEGVEDHVGVLLALMMQESGGRGDDPMQASESLCGSVGCITDPETSIEQGVAYFADTLEQADQDVKLALQSYNFGGGFIDFVMDNGGSYTQGLAIEFSAMKYEELKHTGSYSCIRPEAVPYDACYGDIYYVDEVLGYYDFSDGVGSGEWTVPIEGALDITSSFGRRDDPFTGERENHKGIDFACIGGVTPIQSVDSGRVVYASQSNGYGNLVMVDHGDIISAYGHLSSIHVDKGEVVESGKKLGVCGSTGNSTGPHLHLEAKTEEWRGHQDPLNFLDLGEG
ncbi:lysozyme family protein [Halobacillus sp. A5]|uniref:lysozyme family protein n=1 Tax=Halobacillus sp. A5 TaxID=2880263 RepID=UPI0020A6A232|nr:lysozyme family protein [Halobacillus sp. A5]MCP3029657.1 lysozyme family protein [Halobacillus sp. A5]